MSYQEKALETASAGFDMSNVSPALLHGAIGLVTEASELLQALAVDADKIDRPNLIEELGDIEWYLALVYREVGMRQIDQAPRVTTPPLDTAIAIVVASSEVLDIIKKSIYYSREVDYSAVTEALSRAEWLLAVIRLHFGLDRAEIQRLNIEKLQKKRYKKGKFTAEEATNRDLAAERQVFEPSEE
jgi:hypothetical protein